MAGWLGWVVRKSVKGLWGMPIGSIQGIIKERELYCIRGTCLVFGLRPMHCGTVCRKEQSQRNPMILFVAFRWFNLS